MVRRLTTCALSVCLLLLAPSPPLCPRSPLHPRHIAAASPAPTPANPSPPPSHPKPFILTRDPSHFSFACMHALTWRKRTQESSSFTGRRISRLAGLSAVHPNAWYHGQLAAFLFRPNEVMGPQQLPLPASPTLSPLPPISAPWARAQEMLNFRSSMLSSLEVNTSVSPSSQVVPSQPSRMRADGGVVGVCCWTVTYGGGGGISWMVGGVVVFGRWLVVSCQRGELG